MKQTPGQTRVFVVDDEANIVSSLATILQIHGFDARAFTEPLAALGAARQDCPDLLISDVFMPVLSGIDLAIQMRRQCPDCKVLLFSVESYMTNSIPDNELPHTSKAAQQEL